MVFHVLPVQKIADGRLSDLDDDAGLERLFASSQMWWRALRDQRLDSRAASLARHLVGNAETTAKH
jgi:hypothetical protein